MPLNGHVGIKMPLNGHVEVIGQTPVAALKAAAWPKFFEQVRLNREKVHPCFDWHLLNSFRKTIAGPSQFQTRSWFTISDQPKKGKF